MIGLAVVLIAVMYVVFMRADPPKSVATDSAPEPTELNFKKSDYGEAWPFKTIESGMVYCTQNSVLFRDDRNGQIYALNGTAKTEGRSMGYNWKSLDDEHIVGKDIGWDKIKHIAGIIGGIGAIVAAASKYFELW
jgi:hypothetical protein